LLLRANQVVNIDELIEELWDGKSPKSAVRTTQTYIYQLRRFIEKERLGGELLITQAPGYVLRVQPGQLDVEAFQSLTCQGRRHLDNGCPDRAADVLRHALDLWRGPALTNVPQGRVLEALVVPLEELRLQAIELRIQAELHLGRHRELIGELRSLIAAHPLNEWFHGKLILALAKAGRRSEALLAYRSLRSVLAEELGLEPSPEIQRLHHAVLTGAVLTQPIPDTEPAYALAAGL
jgi:DNA-binding SARP family transcriptional activator